MLPANWENPLQLVPNWYAITSPETTPMPKLTANIFSQKWYNDRQTSFLVRSHMPSSTTR